MIDVKEHIYHDDPNVGHADVRTELKDAAYFFLGNGLIQAAVQTAPGGDGTPVGLLIMDPERLRKKREALTMDERTGLDRTGVRARHLEKSFSLDPGASKTISLKYVFCPERDEVAPAFSRKTAPDKSAASFWTGLTRLSFGHKLLDRYFEASRVQLPAVISGTGRLDGAIWQYNREWLRDQAVIALAMAMLGAHDRARTMFHRLIDKFVTDEGDTVASRPRSPKWGSCPGLGPRS